MGQNEHEDVSLAIKTLHSTQEMLLKQGSYFKKKQIDFDKSTIVRDYAIEALCNFAKAGESQALLAYPLLKDSLNLWEGKHRGRILKGLLNVCKNSAIYTLEIRGIAEEFSEDDRGVVKKAAGPNRSN